MFVHQHPYKPFLNINTRKLIVGTLPPPRFTTGELHKNDVDFCYGSYHNSLWKFIDKIHQLNLRYDNSKEAIKQRKQFLIQHDIGICDIVESAERDKIDASDLGMKNVKLRNILGYLNKYPNINTVLFIGGNSKNGPEYFFRKHLKDNNVKLKLISNDVPRVHEFVLPLFKSQNHVRLSAMSSAVLQGEQTVATSIKKIKTVSLTSSSGAANISIGRNPLYKQLKAKNPNFNTFDFRVMQYREFI